MRFSIYFPFLAAAAVGFVLAAIEHLASLTGDHFLSPGQRTVVYMGMVVVFVPAAYASKALAGRTKKHDWRFVLRATPPWARYGTFFLIIYAIVMMLLFTDTFSSATFKGHPPHEDPNSPRALRSNTAHAMALYWISAALLYSAINAPFFDRRRRCGNGHLIEPTEDTCKLCGAPVMNQL
jgi:hypothetical protein